MYSMQHRPPNANKEVSNTNHFCSVSDSLGRLASASECMSGIHRVSTVHVMDFRTCQLCHT